jgi:hypothetical protein
MAICRVIGWMRCQGWRDHGEMSSRKVRDFVRSRRRLARSVMRRVVRRGRGWIVGGRRKGVDRGRPGLGAEGEGGVGGVGGVGGTLI